MSKRMTAIAATALALAVGCEEGYGDGTAEETEETEVIGQEEVEPAQREEEGALERERFGQAEQQGTAEETEFNQGPGVGIEEENEPIAQAPQQRQMEQQRRMEHQRQMEQQRQMGQQGQMGQMGQQQQLGQAGSPGQVVTTPSERNFAQTISQLQRQMRQNDLEIVGQVRYDERMRQRMMREQQQQQRAQGGQQPTAQGEIGDVRLLVFRHPNAEVMSIENQGAEALLDAPRTVLVYEQGEQVIVAYRAPQEMAAIGTEEPTSELLARVVRDATQPTPTAQRGEADQDRIARAERRRLEREQQAQEQAQPDEGMDVDVSVTEEDRRQARAPQY